MKKRSKIYLAGSLFLFFTLFLLASCGGGGGGGTPPAASSSVVVTACTGTISATVNALGITAFSPAAVTISANQVVQWGIPSGVNHTVTSTTVPANGTFNVALANGAMICLKFTATGTFNYQCSIHPVMTGSVTVN